MELMDIAKKIEKKINDLDAAVKELRNRAEDKANAQANYEKVLAITIIELKNGNPKEIDGNFIKDVPVTICEKIAKGLCWKEKLESDKAEAFYKNLITGIDVIQSQLNGYQSINRYLKEL